MKIEFKRILSHIRRYSSKVVQDDVPEVVEKTFKKSRFIDSLRIFVRGGSGGQGFPKYGGSGGKGGDVCVIANSEIKNLQTVYMKNPQKRYTAPTGHDARKHVLLGDPGQDLHINVPLGVTVECDHGVIGDLNEEGQIVCVAKGGEGGNRNNNFIGRKGEAQPVILNLKLIADIGLVGFPNAGKSTFLAAISRTKPKIASYPFTTMRPQIGMMEYKDFRQITIADLPGLVEGAHVNVGLGHKFLKHVERTKLLLLMVDVHGFKLGYKYNHRTAFETVLLLMKELELYREDLIDKPAILALNKIDLDPEHKRADEVLELVKSLPDSLSEVDSELRPSRLIKFDYIMKISAKARQSTEELKDLLRGVLDEHYEESQENQTSQEELDIYRRSKFLKEHSKTKVA